MDYNFNKHFTLAEANALIPAVRRLFEHLHGILNLDPQSPAARTNGNGNGNGHGTVYVVPVKDVDREKTVLEILDALSQQGIVVQDPVRGLIDFPSIQEGEEVLLCYELSDGNSVQYYHDLDAGYAGRQPIDEDIQ